jgi:AcrR family transcriptional regulator
MRLLDTGGPGAVTLRAVGDAAGISQSAPYRHYEDKRALLEAMVRANLDYFNSALEKARRDQPAPFGALDRLVRAYFDFARRFPVRYRFLLEVSREDSQLGAEVRQAFGAVTALVRTAQQAGELRGGDPEQISALIFGAAYGMADLAQYGLATLAAREGAVALDDAPDLAPLLLDLLAACRTEFSGRGMKGISSGDEARGSLRDGDGRS